MSETVAPPQVDYAAVLRDAGDSAAAQARALYDLVLAEQAGSAEASHAEAGRGREHTLLAAAVAYCLAYELRASGAAVDPDLLRLAALAHDLDLPEPAQAHLPAQVRRWVADRRIFFDALPGSPFPLGTFNSPAEQALYAAHLVTSLPLPVPLNQPAPRAFAAHPLGRGQPLSSLALVAAGVVDAAEYLFESSRLPEVRGAGRLLARLSRVDVPALFGATFADAANAARASEVRAWFTARWGAPPLEAPECVLHAASGGLLALAPASQADALAAAVEALYTEQTGAAQAMAAARRCDLLELQYGLEPTRFWRLEYEAAQADADLRALVADERRFEANLETTGFPPGKGFGELVAAVELGCQRRRDERAHYPNWETLPYARRCPACDRRAAAALAPDGTPLCEPCARKAAAGAGPRTGQPEPIAYLGLIYADVDGVRDYLERLRAPSDYRDASHRLAAAMERAVQAALARHAPGSSETDGSGLAREEIIALRGDGTVLLVPGARALAVASALGRAFEAEFALPAEGDPWAPHRYRPPRGGRSPAVATPVPTALTLSAGVAIAPAVTPLPLLRDLAAQLLRAAKRARAQATRERPDPHRGGSCDFLVLDGPGVAATRLDDWRAALVRRDRRDAPELRQYAAPYTWPEIEGLLAAARELGALRLPRAATQRLGALLTQGEAAASVDYLYFCSRAPEPVRQALTRLEDTWRSRGGRADVAPPWRWLLPGPDRRERRETVLADVLALAALVAQGEPPGAAHATR
ncbi:MAG TPA: hypothetical protein VII06_37595 [Chloroflexota bacterium]|jgi:hypothetical protein